MGRKRDAAPETKVAETTAVDQPEVESTEGAEGAVEAASTEKAAEAPKRSEAETRAWIGERVTKLSEKLRQAITDGDVVTSIGTVTISAKASPTKAEAKQDYLVLEAMTGAGMGAINGGRIRPRKEAPAEGPDTRTAEEKLYGACDWHNYGYDLNVRADIRGALMATLEGPEKAIANVVKSLRAIDFSDEDITASVMKGKFSTHPQIAQILAAALAPAGK